MCHGSGDKASFCIRYPRTCAVDSAAGACSSVSPCAACDGGGDRGGERPYCGDGGSAGYGASAATVSRFSLCGSVQPVLDFLWVVRGRIIQRSRARTPRTRPLVGLLTVNGFPLLVDNAHSDYLHFLLVSLYLLDLGEGLRGSLGIQSARGTGSGKWRTDQNGCCRGVPPLWGGYPLPMW